MSGSKIGGQRAAVTNKSRHGDDFYAKIGAKGGHLGTTGGFYANRELAREAGRKGGLARQGKKYPGSHSKDKGRKPSDETINTIVIAHKALMEAPVPTENRFVGFPVDETDRMRPINGEADILVPIKKSLFSKLFRRK